VFPGSAVDPLFQFFQIRHQSIEGWRFDKEHFPHVSVVASNPRKLVLWREDSKAPRFGQIIPRRSLTEKDFLVLYHAGKQPEVGYRILTVFVPVQAGEVAIMTRKAGRHLSRVEDCMEQRCLLPECSFRS